MGAVVGGWMVWVMSVVVWVLLWVLRATSLASCTCSALLHPTVLHRSTPEMQHPTTCSQLLPAYPPSARLLHRAPAATALQGNARDMLQDVNTGIAWVLKHAAAFGGDGKTFHLVGQSAGGQLGALALISQVGVGAAGAAGLCVVWEAVLGRTGRLPGALRLLNACVVLAIEGRRQGVCTALHSSAACGPSCL